MKSRNGVAPMKTVNLPVFAARVRFGLVPTFAAPFLLSAAAMVAIPARPAVAACVQSGSTVSCDGASTTGFGTGTENNLTLTVQSNASITVPSNGGIGINLNNGNTAINNGSITAGNQSVGMQGGNNNTFTNAGTITVGDQATAILMTANNNTVTNSGAIGSTGSYVGGLKVGGDGNLVINSGTITLTGTVYATGIEVDGTGNTVQNSGTITVGSSSSSSSVGVYLWKSNNFTNSGTIKAAGDGGLGIVDNGNIVINGGTIVATGAAGSGVFLGGSGNKLINNGMIKGGVGGYSLVSLGSTGDTIANNGTLDGAVSLLGNGGTLTNNGLITITDPATALAPDNFSFNGTVTQTAQGTLALRVDSTGLHDGLSAGQIKLDGTLRAVLQSGLYQQTTTYTNVVQGSSVGGQFANVTSSSAFFTAAATYNASSVDLTLTRQGFGAVAGETANQRAVGNALEAGYSTALTGSTATFYSNLLQSGSVRVLDQLSGEGTSGTQNAAFTAGSMFGQSMDGQMDAWRTGHRGEVTGAGALGYAAEQPTTSAFNALKAPPLVQPQWNAWASGFGAGQSLSGNATVGSATFSDRIAGGAAGVDHLLNPDLLVGIAVGGSSASFSVDDRATSGRLDGAHVGAYAMQRFGASYVSAQLAYSHFNNSTTRTITGIGTDEIAKGSFGSDQLGGRLEVGRTYDFARVSVTPYAAIQAAQLWQAAYTETSTAGTGTGVMGLSYTSHTVSSLPVFLGTKFDARFDVGNGMMWMPFANVAWVHEFSPTRDVTASLITLQAPAFTVEGAHAASDAGRVEVGSRLALNHWSELSTRFTGEFAKGSQSYAGMGALKVSW
ncbi:autotransporter domain-containing protein [Bradyrhizobium sp. CCGUVB1N3]|uniref:autotransporter outer membrane beta-barrel domain-containing protein n=1 Tax=Bradyrhizobium sp. CCGUVB1N3 TaxID=2949629 RepID=UPI0020B1DC13|nr:autotransporter domain-containing protein [Bradyrhizobium sp. CCGUVB1N3]MCP3473101.1 autotransporter domain-containing protein [Bradyrhizobium sp. CCGUVB1N3]